MSFTLLLGLIVCNAIWATNPLMGKILMERFSPMEVSWLRYFSASLACILILFFKSYSNPLNRDIPRLKKDKKLILFVFLVGVVTFYGSPLAQYIGLARSTATENAVLVSIEPIAAVFLAWIFLKEKIKFRDCLAMFFALIGFLLLSNVRPSELGKSLQEFNMGNLFLLAAMPMEATYTIISRAIGGKLHAISLFSLGLTLGIFILTVSLLLWNIPLASTLSDLQSLSYKEAVAIFWMGPLGTTITYIFWTKALEGASVFAVSLTLFTQPIVGAINGALILDERLNFWQIIGALIITTGLLIKTSKKERPDHVGIN
ncbi:MAG: DMT family transporter [Oligoflexia bacterium]|nr:DMT family transporter [Oligoflexia bacterium]